MRDALRAGGVPKVFLAALVLVTAVATGPLQAQNHLLADSSPVPTGGTSWSFGITPYVWLAAQSTDVGGRALRQSFTDLASITNLGFQGRAALRIRKVLQARVLAARSALLRIQSERLAARIDLHLALGGSFEATGTGP